MSSAGKLLRYNADLRTLVFVFGWVALLVVGYTLTLPWWGMALYSIGLSLGSFFCAVITHNI